MSHTNKTEYYELPQFVGTDIINPLTDINGAFSSIDTNMHNIAVATGADATEIVSIKGRLDTAEGKITAIETQNGAEVLTTTAQTLSGGINELDAELNTASTGVVAKVNALDNDVNNASTGLKVKVSSLETDTSTISGKIGNGSLNTEASTIIGGVNEVNAKVTKANNQRNHSYILAVGDSYIANAPATSWPEKLKAHLPSATIIKNGYGNSGFIGIESAKTFLTSIQELVSNLADPSVVTDVVVLGGLNDAAAIHNDSVSLTDICNAIQTFINYVNTNLPNASIHIGFCGWMAYGYTYRDAQLPVLKHALYAYRRAPYMDTTGKCSYINGIEFVMPPLLTNVSYAADLIHPNEDASNRIAAGVYNYLKTGCAGNVSVQSNASGATGIGMVAKSPMTAVTQNGLKYYNDLNVLQIKGGDIEFSADAISFNSNSDVDLAYIPYDPIRACTSEAIRLNCFAYVFEGSSFAYYPAVLKIANGEVSFKVVKPDNSGFSNVGTIIITVPSCSLDVFEAC